MKLPKRSAIDQLNDKWEKNKDIITRLHYNYASGLVFQFGHMSDFNNQLNQSFVLEVQHFKENFKKNSDNYALLCRMKSFMEKSIRGTGVCH
ncbi:hypothetical protein [Paenibacillus apii]|uniref:hypothetical protein n=1 Tax=Paenibacillus apii TaxID=1850370 RepID=UPI00143A88A1|nr:hypothetical protein [Paenibacillus apii]NJJ38909.1 hypothetical protein [Paenibacillus apii]